ncbi:glutathione hydrolase 6 isoform X3 [Chiloscyllium plagiosum]|uniref:glutathione hydrolase 6 isoform X3 n=1 Tax=Chiloscyllium plagiosum TaxID=36176 RepID=UPI001CB7F2D7|nr:glutathione hydrolase 6 isoform X3 [Chiloscyllium plagiosum]
MISALGARYQRVQAEDWSEEEEKEEEEEEKVTIYLHSASARSLLSRQRRESCVRISASLVLLGIGLYFGFHVLSYGSLESPGKGSSANDAKAHRHQGDKVAPDHHHEHGVYHHAAVISDSGGAVSAIFHSKMLGVTKVLNAYPVDSLNLSFGIPSTLQGLRLLHREYGSLAWAELFQRPVELARKGFPIDRVLAGAAKEAAIRGTDLCPILCDGGQQLKGAGVNTTNGKLADVLERVSTEMGEANFPESLARRLARDLPRKGRQEFVRAAVGQRAALVNPLVSGLDRFSLYAAPPPASGGILARIVKQAGQLNLSLSSLSGSENASAAYWDILDAARRVYQSQSSFPSPAPWSRQKQREDKPSNKTSPAGSQVVVIDHSGNILAMVGSLNSAFGAGFLSPSTGIFLSDFTRRMDSDIHLWACPAVLTAGGGDDLVAVVSTGGSSVPFAIAQMVLNKVYFERSTKEAVSGPHFYLNVGEGGTLRKLVSGLKRDSEIYTLLLREEPELELVNETAAGVTVTMVGIHLGHISAFGQPQAHLYADGY